MAKVQLSEEQKDFIREMAPVLSDDKLTDQLNAKFNSELKRSTVSYVRRQLGVHKVRGRGVCRVREDVQTPHEGGDGNG